MKSLSIAAALLLCACSKAGEAPEISVTDAWARPTVAGQSATAAYLTIANSGAGEDRLLSIAVPAPAMAMIHETTNDQGIARMRPVEGGLAVAGRKTVTLAPGGAHVMIMGLQAPLKPGATFPLTLRFERSGERKVEARVLAPAER